MGFRSHALPDGTRLNGFAPGSRRIGPVAFSRRLADEFADRLRAFDADELLVEAAVEVGEAVGVEAQLLQDGGVQVLDVERLLHGAAAELVGLADADTALDAASCRPHGKAVGVVVAAGALLVLGGWLAA